MTANGFWLGNVAVFLHPDSYRDQTEELYFKYSKNFQTKYFSRHIAKPMLAVRLSFIVALLVIYFFQG